MNLPEGRGRYHPSRACAFCGAGASRGGLREAALRLTSSVAYVCVDQVVCVRRQLERRRLAA